MTPAEIKAECENIWNKHALAFHSHKAGLIFRTTENVGRGGYYETNSPYLLRVRGAKIRAPKRKSKYRGNCPQYLTPQGIDYNHWIMERVIISEAIRRRNE